MRRWPGLLLCLLVLLPWSLAWATNTHQTPDEARERQAWFGDVTSPYIHSGCLPSVPASSLTFGTFACTGYVRAASNDLVYVSQAAAVEPLNAGNGTYWLALHRDTSTSVSSWTRQSGTHYLWRQTSSHRSSRQPTTSTSASTSHVPSVIPLPPRAPPARPSPGPRAAPRPRTPSRFPGP
jgi:hypothetical protein